MTSHQYPNHMDWQKLPSMSLAANHSKFADRSIRHVKSPVSNMSHFTITLGLSSVTTLRRFYTLITAIKFIAIGI